MADINFMKPKAESIKENARPRRFPFIKFAKKKPRLPILNIGIRKKKISNEELTLVKNKIREKMGRSRRRKTILRIILAILLLIPSYFVAQRFYKSLEEGKALTEKHMEEAYAHRQQLIIEGFQQLKLNQFVFAKLKFLKAAEIDPKDYLLQLGLSTSYVKMCRYKGVDCENAKTSVNKLVLEYGNQPEVEKLYNEYTEMLRWKKRNSVK